MTSSKLKSDEKQNHLSSLLSTYSVDNSGQIEKNKCSAICQELQVTPGEAVDVFDPLDLDKHGSVTLEEFLNRFKQQEEGDGGEEDENCSPPEELSTSKERIVVR